MSTTGWPNVMTAVLDGGPGDDVLTGSRGEDVMLAGETGHDKLYGGDGDDALISEAANGNKDGDELYGQGGDDQLVTDYPCGGHFYSGGPGFDIAGFARAGSLPIRAQLAGAASTVTAFHGFALSYNPTTGNNDCGQSSWTRFSPTADLEVLEGAAGNDELWGNNAANVIWARDGNDKVWGLDGNDELWGHTGDDTIYAGLGADRVYGGRRLRSHLRQGRHNRYRAELRRRRRPSRDVRQCRPGRAERLHVPVAHRGRCAAAATMRVATVLRRVQSRRCSSRIRFLGSCARGRAPLDRWPRAHCRAARSTRWSTTVKAT